VFGWDKTKGEWVTIAPKGRAWTPFIYAHGVFSGVQYVFKHVRASVKAGDNVKAGSVIARSGQLGFSQGPHLHFEVWPTPKSSVDPVKWFAAKGVVF
jgi:murein DD-endopeptidase MepM/ murein hydrolase activator NlpD